MLGVSMKKSDVWDGKMKETKLMEVTWSTALIVIDKKKGPKNGEVTYLWLQSKILIELDPNSTWHWTHRISIS